MSKFSDIGLFWEYVPGQKVKKGEILLPMARIPNTGWKAPRDFPNLRNAKLIGVDTETYDPELTTHGPGWARDSGHVVGVSVSVEDEGWYFPFRHEVQKETNMDRESVMKFLKDALSGDTPKVGANIGYDEGWLHHEGVILGGILYDVQYAEALLFDTAKSYSLDTLSNKYLNVGKTSELMYKWAAESYGGPPTSAAQGGNIYRCPPCIVGKYAEDDAIFPIRILQEQVSALKKEDMWDLFILECKLIRVWNGMRRRGLHIDETKAEKVKLELTSKIEELQMKLNKIVGHNISADSPTDLVKAYTKLGYKYAKTPAGNPSFSSMQLNNNPNEISSTVLELRKFTMARDTFVTNAILNKHVDGVLYPSFHPLRGDSWGTVSGRLSCTNPNSQQIPSRDEYLGPLIRGLFIPEKGYESWIKLDYSQVEYRIFAHVSEDPMLINSYKDPNIDYHDIVSNMLMGLLPRKIVKTLNFGSLFGMGAPALALNLTSMLTAIDAEKVLHSLIDNPQFSSNVELYDLLARSLLITYNEKFPAARESLQRFSNEIQHKGEIRTLLGRRSTFSLWEPCDRSGKAPLPYARAKHAYGRIQRAGSHKGLNRITQGGSADILKLGLLNAYEEGLLNEDRLGFPHITVHDELDFSYNEDLKEDFKILTGIMENSIALNVPIIMDCEIGPNWGEVKEVIL